MKFPWGKYKEVSVSKRNTLQIFITNRCNLKCKGCFARHTMVRDKDISFKEYEKAILESIEKGAKQINLLGGEPFLHPELERMLALNSYFNLKTTIYTNGLGLRRKNNLYGAKLRVSIYRFMMGNKSLLSLPHYSKIKVPFDANFMVGKNSKYEELLEIADICEIAYHCKVFFISSLRELDNPRQEFFDDTDLTMPVIQYKELVHQFLEKYEGNMEIHISKRGVFESTLDLPHNKCKFANYFIGGKIIQCPYDVVNLKYQKDYEFDKRHCQQNNTCLMSKIIVRREKSE